MSSESKLQLVCLQDYEEHASQVLPPFVLDFYRGGADQEQTLRDNRESFKRYVYKYKFVFILFSYYD